VIRVCFAGLTGWAAPPILAGIAASEDLRLVAGVARSSAGRALAEVTGLDVEGEVHASIADALGATAVDVLVDYTSAEAVRGNVEAAIAGGVHTVVGSSGLTADDFAELDEAAREAGVGVFAAGNFSVMAAVLLRMATMAAGKLEHWEVIDYAGDRKPDVPSGTAREVAESMATVATPVPALPVEELHGPVEARGAAVGGTRIHSVRLPGFVVSTEVVFASTGERLVMRHDAGPDPEPYAAGTLLAVRRVPSLVGAHRGLDTLLFD
jgi:4-hydroxy-tetrahydrodipicolinate reductase